MPTYAGDRNHFCPGCGAKLLFYSKKRAARDPDTAYRCASRDCGYYAADDKPRAYEDATCQDAIYLLGLDTPGSVTLMPNHRATIARFLCPEILPKVLADRGVAITGGGGGGGR